MIIPVFDRTGHQLLWGWLSSHPGMLLYDWPGWKDNGGTYSSCKYANFACQYDLDMRMLTRCYNEYSIANKKCLHCPFGNYAHKECLNHHYLKWLSATKVYSALKSPASRERWILRHSRTSPTSLPNMLHVFGICPFARI